MGGGRWASRRRECTLDLVVGFRYDVREWTGDNVLGKLEPIYDRQPPGTQQLVIARDGYAVGGLVVDAGKFVQAVRVIFMMLDGDHLDSHDSYQSEWLGNPSADEPKTLAGNGQMVVGVYGGHGIILDSVGLVLRKR